MSYGRGGVHSSGCKNNAASFHYNIGSHAVVAAADSGAVFTAGGIDLAAVDIDAAVQITVIYQRRYQSRTCRLRL